MSITLLLFGAALILLGLAAWLLEWKPTIDWPFFWRKWSTWLAGLNAALWAHITATSGMLLGFVAFIPLKLQIPAVIAVFLIGWIIPVVAAHIRQSKVRDATLTRSIEKALKND